MASFFVRAALGQYELNTPDQLLKLLATMARNKLANQAHGQRAARRDVRREQHGDDQAADVADRGGTPSRQVAARELLDAARAGSRPRSGGCWSGGRTAASWDGDRRGRRREPRGAPQEAGPRRRPRGP